MIVHAASFLFCVHYSSHRQQRSEHPSLPRSEPASQPDTDALVAYCTLVVSSETSEPLLVRLLDPVQQLREPFL